MFTRNEAKFKFKEVFKKEIEKMERGSFLTDSEIKDFAKKNDFKFSFNEIMSIIRQMELDVGLSLKKRLKRMRNEGYLILEPKVQVDTALREGKEKVEIALRKTANRLESVEVSSFTPEQQRELLARTMAIDSLLTIVKNSSITRKAINRKEVEMLSHTATQSNVIKKRKD